jgi:hypothetical protein
VLDHVIRPVLVYLIITLSKQKANLSCRSLRYHGYLYLLYCVTCPHPHACGLSNHFSISTASGYCPLYFLRAAYFLAIAGGVRGGGASQSVCLPRQHQLPSSLFFCAFQCFAHLIFFLLSVTVCISCAADFRL